MKMLAVLIGTVILLISLPVVAQHGPQLTSYVYIMNADGSNQRPLFPYPLDARTLDVSPDGTRVAYSTGGRGGFEIWVCDIDGSNAVNLTESSGISEFGPSWSPDGSRIAFTSNSEGNTEVFVMDADGQNVSNLTNHPAGDGGPVWSPNGNRFAFSSDREGSVHIFVMNTDGSGIVKVTNNVVENAVFYGDAAWSPDGNRIVYVAIVGLERHIYLLNVTGDPPRPLVTNARTAEHPSWSPDRNLIAFASNLEGNPDIFVMDPGGQDVVNLTRGMGMNEHPAWTPDGRVIYKSRRSRDEIRIVDRQLLGIATTLTLFERGGLSFEKRTDDMPPARILRRNSAGRLEYVPLDRDEAERILHKFGHTHIKLEEFFGP